MHFHGLQFTHGPIEIHNRAYRAKTAFPKISFTWFDYSIITVKSMKNPNAGDRSKWIWKRELRVVGFGRVGGGFVCFSNRRRHVPNSMCQLCSIFVSGPEGPVLSGSTDLQTRHRHRWRWFAALAQAQHWEKIPVNYHRDIWTAAVFTIPFCKFYKFT